MLLNYREYGEAVGTPLLILHGLFGSLENWHGVAQRLAERRWVVSVDLRNHGGSPHSPHFTYPLLAADVVEVVEHLETGRITLLGHSMGGKTAMEIALSRGDLVDRLIVVDIAPRRYQPRHEDLRDAMLAVDLTAIRSRREADAILARSISDPVLRLFLLKNLRRDEMGRFHWRLDLDSLSANFSNLWEEIDGGRAFSGPTLFLRGALSTYVLDEDVASIRRHFPAAQLETIEDAGHWLHADQPESIIDAVNRFCPAGG